MLANSAYAAYEVLPETNRKRIAGLRAVFSHGGNTRNKFTGMAASSLDKDARETTTVIHPVACVHPVTQRPAIYVNPLVTERIVDLPEAESDALLDELYDWIDRPEFHWEHEWWLGDTLMRENRGGLMHCGRLDYPRDQRRRLIRTTERGQAIEANAAA